MRHTPVATLDSSRPRGAFGPGGAVGPGAAALALVLLVLGACGGGGGERPGPAAGDLRLEILASSASAFRASVTFGTPSFATVEAAGETFTRVESAGCRPGSGNDGEPGVPVLLGLLAVPQGARAVVSDVRPTVASMRILLLHPFQVQEGEYSPAFEREGPIPLDEDDWVPPFAYDRAAYGDRAPYPSAPVRLSPASSGRDLALAVLEVAAGRYVPATRELTLYASVDFTVTFEGGSGTFLPNGARNPFEEGSKTAKSAAWNQAAIESGQGFVPPPHLVYGEELLILTHPAYRTAADRLAAHKTARGVLTTVVTVNDGAAGGAPDTKEQIKAFLDDRVDSALVRFSYLLILGDAQDVEPWMLPRRYTTGDFPSDFPYVQFHTDPLDDDLFPDAAIGRIPVGSLAQADVVVDKIIKYESDPPAVLGNATFYGRAAIASYFQPGEGGAPPYVENYRRFLQDSEDVRNHLLGHGFQAERIYTAALPLTAATAPRYYRDGVTPLPAPLRPEDGYPWDGDAQDIIAAFNAGKSLFFHVDHGGTAGWGHPHFVTDDLPSLVNGDLLPLVLSDNCSSGAFDLASPGFAESILRMAGGGAIGVMAFTRNSNNGVGRQFLDGVVDALWPDAYPGFGDAEERHRLGDMLNHARARMTKSFAGGSAGDAGYLVAWAYARMLSLFGDPTLAVWVENPNPLPPYVKDIVVGPAIDLVYPYEGATITVFEDAPGGPIPIGRAVAGPGGAVTIDPVVAPRGAASLRFFASAPGAVGAEVVPEP